MNRRISWFAFAGILAVAVVCVGTGGLALTGQGYSQRYAGRIFPGVSVYGVELGGLTVEEAAASLEASLPDPAALELVLRDGERTWSRSWADLMIRLDSLATAQVAYQAGRAGTPQQQYSERLQALLTGWSLSPVIVLPSTAQATEALEALAPEVFVPPVNASLIIEPSGITPLAARVGRALDVEATAAALPHAIVVGTEGLTVDLLTRHVEPAIRNPGDAHTRAEALLSQPFTLTAEDTLTDFSTAWAVEPTTVAGWLTAQEATDGAEPRLVVVAQEEPIRATLESLGSQLPADLALDAEATAPRVRAALEAGENRASAKLIHPPHTYTVQPGDTLMSIGRAHGFPAWWLTQANPDIDPEALYPGQQIIIPSIDVHFPYPLITSRRIVIDLSDQRLYAYEGETLVYNFVCSTGIPSSPTTPGTFQILSKEENAYASSWNLWMPHFLGVYRSGPDFTNGIHGLPVRDGQQLRWALGSPASYGCIVLGLDEAATLYEWAELGTLVIIQE